MDNDGADINGRKMSNQRIVRRTPYIAGPHQMYVGLYHWSRYWGHWDVVLAVDGIWWTVQSVDVDGRVLPGEDGRVRRHCTSMEANLFADRPFDVIYGREL